jgi:hypothetical protein
MTENWKPVIDFPNYEISDAGRVRSIKNNIIRKDQTHRQGYKQIYLYKNGNRHYFLVHTLVATHYIPNTKNKPEVNHKDGNKANNHVSNLEWVTRSENMLHLYENGWSMLSKRVQRSDGLIFRSTLEAERQLGLTRMSVSRAANPKQSSKYAGGYTWKYID